MKISNTQIQEIVMFYIYSDISMEELAQSYGCSTSTISKAIHKAIFYGDIDEKTAIKIRDVAASNMDKKMREMGFHKSYKVERKYNWIMRIAKRRKKLLEELEKLRADIETYDDTFGESDNYPYSKDYLELAMEKIEKEIQEIEKEFKKST